MLMLAALIGFVAGIAATLATMVWLANDTTELRAKRYQSYRR